MRTHILKNSRLPYLFLFLFSYLIIASGVISGDSVAHGQNVDQLRDQITDHAKKIEELEREITEYSKQLNIVGHEKQTLTGAINTLDVSRKKITTDIKLTESKISATDLSIKELERQIALQELAIERDTVTVLRTIQSVDELESTTMFETLLSNGSLTTFWDEIEVLTQIRDGMRADMVELAAAKQNFESAVGKSKDERVKLSGLKAELGDEQKVLDANREEKNKLLVDTKNKEANYQALLNEKIAARQKFEAEMHAYEAQLSFALDTSTIPAVGAGVLQFPFEPGYTMQCPGFQSALGNAQCITQYFGSTPFARSGAYSGKGHNGIDFRAPSGTKITAALAGTVKGVGDTDAVAGCYSYGKWVLIEHSNGISSLYAHLSVISVGAGQQIPTGGVVGYSGSTGYSTGPHLHFSVYASGGVKLQRLADIPGRPITGCSAATIPVAGLEAYLNPLDYL